jgi:hypothetical protein
MRRTPPHGARRRVGSDLPGLDRATPLPCGVMHWLPPEGRIDTRQRCDRRHTRLRLRSANRRVNGPPAIAPTDLVGTIKTIALALTQMEREAGRNRRSGAVKKAATERRSRTPPPKRNRDARKTDAGAPAAATARSTSSDTPRPKPWNHRPWESSDGPYPFKDCKGPHWKIYCPAHPPTEAGTGQAKVAAGQVTATNNEECDACTFDNPTLSFHDMVGLAFPESADERIVEVDPSTAIATARACVATVQAAGELPTAPAASKKAVEPAPSSRASSSTSLPRTTTRVWTTVLRGPCLPTFER